MARTGQTQDTNQSATMTANQGQAFQAGQGYLSEFQQNLNTLRKGGNVAPNPWQSPGYLSNVNRLQSEAMGGAKTGTTQEINSRLRRSGGMNGTSAYGAIRDTGLQTARLGNQLSAERYVGDVGKNVSYQTEMAGMPLAGAAAENPYYGTSVSGTDASNNALTQLGIAQYGPWNSLISGVTGSAGYSKGGF